MKRKFLIGALCASMVVTSVAPAFASEPSITTDTYNAEGQVDCTVTIDGGESSFEVILPKLMDGNAVSKSINWDYTVTVSGDIAGTESIKVVPEDTVTLKQDNKANVIGTIKQNKTVFNCDEVRKTTSTTGNVSASGLSAGDWAGSFWFNINMDNIQVLLVEAFDMNDTDLHARGFEITGTEKASLIESLEDAGYSKSNQVFLYDVNADEFEDSAKTIFYLNSLVPVGSIMNVYHYNDGWSKVDSCVVSEDGTIEFNVDSFSPIALELAQKSTPSLSVPEDTYTLHGNTIKVPVTYTGDGSISVTSSDESIVKVSYSDGEITITPVYEGVATITINADAGTLYNQTSTTFKIDSLHNYIDGTCTICNQKDIEKLPAGLYDANWNLKTDWNTLIKNGIIHVNADGMLTTNPTNETTLHGPTGNNSMSALSGILVLDNSVKSLEYLAFANCIYLTGIVIDKNLTNIDDNAFYFATWNNSNYYNRINKYIVNSNNSSFKTVDGVLFDINMETLYKYPTGKTENEYIIPKSVKTIGCEAFAYNNYLQKIICQEGLETIIEGFAYCYNLSSIVFPQNTLKTITHATFNNTKITEIELPSSVENLEYHVFFNTNLRKVYIPDSVNIIINYDTITTFQGSSNVIVYCESSCKKEGWCETWNKDNTKTRPTYFNVTREEYRLK